jgi:hypothetical protein
VGCCVPLALSGKFSIIYVSGILGVEVVPLSLHYGHHSQKHYKYVQNGPTEKFKHHMMAPMERDSPQHLKNIMKIDVDLVYKYNST